MATKDPRIDAYIAKSAEFAQPILKHLRKVVHARCPDVVETLKWSMPHFDHKGVMCGMAAFKQHCAFGFWKADLILEPGARPGEKRNGKLRLHPIALRSAEREDAHRLREESRGPE